MAKNSLNAIALLHENLVIWYLCYNILTALRQVNSVPVGINNRSGPSRRAFGHDITQMNVSSGLVGGDADPSF